MVDGGGVGAAGEDAGAEDLAGAVGVATFGFHGSIGVVDGAVSWVEEEGFFEQFGYFGVVVVVKLDGGGVLGSGFGGAHFKHGVSEEGGGGGLEGETGSVVVSGTGFVAYSFLYLSCRLDQLRVHAWICWMNG